MQKLFEILFIACNGNSGKIFKKKPFEVAIYTAIAQERKGIERSNWVKLVFR